MSLGPALSALSVGLIIGAHFGQRRQPPGCHHHADQRHRMNSSSRDEPHAATRVRGINKVTVAETRLRPSGNSAGYTRPRDEPLHHTIVEVDVADSGHRHDPLQLRMRADLRTIVDKVLAQQGLDPTAIHRIDLGDGIRLIVPAAVSPHALLHPFLPNLAATLRDHRVAAAPDAQLRLRVGVHMGLLHRDADGWAGAPLVHCTRLLNAAPARRALATARHADLVVVASETIYKDVVHHGYGLNPAAYNPIPVTEKETTATGWIHIPGCPS